MLNDKIIDHILFLFNKNNKINLFTYLWDFQSNKFYSKISKLNIKYIHIKKIQFQ